MTDIPLSTELLSDPFDTVRRRCARVAERSRHVRIDPDGLERFAAALPVDEIGEVTGTLYPDLGGDPESLAAFVLCLDAINFGSGWFPVLTKLPGKSGYRTVEAHVSRRFTESGTPTARELMDVEAEQMRALLQQDGGADAAELMELFARAWRELGGLVHERFAGAWLELVGAAGGSAAALVRTLLSMPLYRDVLRYGDLEVPFLKRAQITAADLAAALPDGAGHFDDLDELTIFADNLVPHVLRLDGVLVFEPELVARIEAEELLTAGSPEEIEIRACAVAAVEQLRTHLSQRGHAVRSSDMDYWLWTRGGEPRYKARPRHRARCAYY